MDFVDGLPGMPSHEHVASTATSDQLIVLRDVRPFSDRPGLAHTASGTPVFVRWARTGRDECPPGSKAESRDTSEYGALLDLLGIGAPTPQTLLRGPDIGCVCTSWIEGVPL